MSRVGGQNSQNLVNVVCERPLASFLILESKGQLRVDFDENLNLISFYSNSVGIQIVFFACHWLAMSNSCYNPFIYALLSVSMFSSCLAH